MIRSGQPEGKWLVRIEDGLTPAEAVPAVVGWVAHHHRFDGGLGDREEAEGDADYGDHAGAVVQAAPGEGDRELDHLQEVPPGVRSLEASMKLIAPCA